MYHGNMSEREDAAIIDSSDGLTFALALDPGEGVPPRRIDWDGINTHQNGPLWIHLDRTKQQAQDWLHHESGLDPLAAEALLAHRTAPRATEIDQGLLVVFRGINLNEGAEPDDMIAIRMWLDAECIITLRQHRFKTVRQLRLNIEAGKGPKTTAGILIGIATGITNRLSPVVENLRTLIDDIEDALAEEDMSNVDTRNLAEVRRQAIRLRRYLAPQRDTLRTLAMSVSPLIDARARAELTEASERTARIVEDLEEVRDRAAVSQEEVRAQREIRAGQRMYVLTLVAAVFLPLGLLTGLLGINVGGMPGADNPYAFWVVSGVLVAVAIGLLVFFRRLKWF